MMTSNRGLFNKERIEIYFPSPEGYSFKLGRVNYSKVHPPLELHIHEGMMEIVLIVKGKQIYTVTGNNYLVRSGEIFITFPDEPHSTAGYPEDKSLLYFLIIDLEKLKAGFIGCDDEDGKLIVQSLTGIKRRVFKGSECLKPMLDKVITAYYSDYPFKNTIIRNLISGFIINIIESERIDETWDSSCMQKVLDYIEQNICENINVPMLAEFAGLSEARFKINFRKQIGIPPREYVLRRKIDAAKSMLKNSDITITELAHELSFSSSQYFSTVFKRFTLVSPKEFRNK
jgi:AraC-like DNA-binding protein/quercetin dioxygenase-like cupin family protein